MNSTLEFALRAILIGVGATMIMDLWAIVLRLLRIPSLDLAFLGRWIGHLARGRWFHDRIATTEPIRGERVLGWCAHYAIGVSFAALQLAVAGLDWAHSPTPLPALMVGIATVVAPLLILQPALGAGIVSRRTRAPVFNSLKSTLTHTVFGLGMYATALVTAALWPGPLGMP